MHELVPTQVKSKQNSISFSAPKNTPPISLSFGCATDCTSMLETGDFSKFLWWLQTPGHTRSGQRTCPAPESHLSRDIAVPPLTANASPTEQRRRLAGAEGVYKNGSQAAPTSYVSLTVFLSLCTTRQNKPRECHNGSNEMKLTTTMVAKH